MFQLKCQKFHIWLTLLLWWFNVTILKISIIVKIRLKYRIKLFCCWYSCCIQTSTFLSFCKWSKFWNQISGVLCSHYEWIHFMFMLWMNTCCVHTMNEYTLCSCYEWIHFVFMLRMNTLCVHAMNEYASFIDGHKTQDTWIQNLLYLKKDWNVDVWMQQLYQ